MDLNCNLHTWVVSLQTITLTKITQQLVENAISDPSSTTEPMTVTSRASENAQQLKLPSSSITKILKLVRPITDEMQTFYRYNGSRNRPILTGFGTVDAEKSARAWMNCSDQNPNFLFDLACYSCFEDDIFIHGKHNLYNEQNFPFKNFDYEFLCMSMSNFWYKVYKGQFVQKITKKDFSDEQCKEGLGIAMGSKQFLAIKYFLDKISLTEEGQLWIARTFDGCDNRFKIIIPGSSADIWAKIIRITENANVKKVLSRCMLKSMIQWPYQHLFLEVAQTLTAYLDVDRFVFVLSIIARKKSLGYEDSDYVGLFTGFWKMCKHHIREKQSNRYYAWYLLFLVFKMLDKNIAFMMFDDISADNIANCGDDIKRRYARLIYSKEYEEAQFVMMVCKARCEWLYLALKKYFEEEDRTRSLTIFKKFLTKEV